MSGGASEPIKQNHTILARDNPVAELNTFLPFLVAWQKALPVALEKLITRFSDEIGYVPVDVHGAHLLFQLISRRYDRGQSSATVELDNGVK